MDPLFPDTDDPLAPNAKDDGDDDATQTPSSSTSTSKGGDASSTSSKQATPETKTRVRKKRVVRKVIRRKIVKKEPPSASDKSAKATPSSPTSGPNPFKNALSIDDAPSLLREKDSGGQSPSTGAPPSGADDQVDLFGSFSPSTNAGDQEDLFGDSVEFGDSLFASTRPSHQSGAVETGLFAGLGDDDDDGSSQLKEDGTSVYVSAALDEEEADALEVVALQREEEDAADKLFDDGKESVRLEPAVEDAKLIGRVDMSVVDTLSRQKEPEAPPAKETTIKRKFVPTNTTAKVTGESIDDDLFSMFGDVSISGDGGDSAFDISSYISQNQEASQHRGLFE